MNNQEQNKKTRELIAHISDVINDMDLDTTKPFVGYGERIIHKAIAEASGVKRSMTHVTAGRGIVDSVEHNKYQYEDCAEYYFPLMYPNILIKEHGHLEFGNQTLGEFINILIVLRQESKRINDNYSVKCKCLLNALFGFICRSKLEWAGEVAICVPAKGRELVRSLSITLLKEYELVPLMVHTDSVIATTFKLTPSHKKELHIDGYRVVSELMCNVVIIDKLRYISGGHCHNMCKPRTINSIKYATKRGIDLVNRI